MEDAFNELLNIISKMMKTKLFTAVFGLPERCDAFSGCKDDKNDDAVHAYVMRAAITEAGDLDAQRTVTLINSELRACAIRSETVRF